MVLKGNGCDGVKRIHVAQDEGQMKGSYEHDDERLAAIKVGKCLDLLSYYQIIKTDLLHRIGCFVTECKEGSPVLKLTFPLVSLRFCSCSSLAFHVSRDRSAQDYPARTGGRYSRYSLPEQLANTAKTCFFLHVHVGGRQLPYVVAIRQKRP